MKGQILPPRDERQEEYELRRRRAARRIRARPKTKSYVKEEGATKPKTAKPKTAKPKTTKPKTIKPKTPRSTCSSTATRSATSADKNWRRHRALRLRGPDRRHDVLIVPRRRRLNDRDVPAQDEYQVIPPVPRTQSTKAAPPAPRRDRARRHRARGGVANRSMSARCCATVDATSVGFEAVRVDRRRAVCARAVEPDAQDRRDDERRRGVRDVASFEKATGCALEVRARRRTRVRRHARAGRHASARAQGAPVRRRRCWESRFRSCPSSTETFISNREWKRAVHATGVGVLSDGGDAGGVTLGGRRQRVWATLGTGAIQRETIGAMGETVRRERRTERRGERGVVHGRSHRGCANAPKREISGRLAHGDFRLDNLVLSRGRHANDADVKVLAVLDWELSTVGAPYADVAFNCLPYYLPPGLDLYPTPIRRALRGNPLRGGIRAHVVAIQRFTESDDDGRFDDVAVLRGVVTVSRCGDSRRRQSESFARNASSANAHEMGKLVDVFAKRALVVVKGESVPRGVSDLRVSIDQLSDRRRRSDSNRAPRRGRC